MLNELLRPIYDKYEKIDNSVNTYCNLFVTETMNKLFNYHLFDGRVANRIIEIINLDKDNWEKLDISLWDRKSIVIACLKGDIHGHVCPLIDGEYELSHKWHDKKVPLCANIGHKNFWGKGVNWAFISEPEYYRYKTSI